MKAHGIDPYKQSLVSSPAPQQPTLYPDPEGGVPVATLEPIPQGETLSRESVERAMRELGLAARPR